MNLNVLPLLSLLTLGMLSGCAQQKPVVIEEPRVFTDPMIPPAPSTATEAIRETSVLEAPMSRGGAGLRVREDADVLANVHYVGINQTTDHRQPKKAAETKPRTKDQSIYSPNRKERKDQRDRSVYQAPSAHVPNQNSQ